MPMKELLLLRHAKSSRDDPALDDHDRPLTARGERDAKAMGAHLAEQGLAPALVLCSSARRTRDTLSLVEPFLPAKHETRIEQALYLASASALLKRLRAVNDDVASVMLFAHNPGLQALVLQLARRTGTAAERKRRAAIEDKFPTCALAVLRFPQRRWSSLKEGTGRLVALVLPRALRGNDG
jgi:phosphohistidine phosphatase